MRARSKLILLSATCSALLLAAAAAAFAETGAQRAGHRGGTFVLAQASTPVTVDPSIDYGTAWTEIIMSHDGLVAFAKVNGAHGGDIVPDLAIAIPKPTDNGKTFTFKLRPGIKYSDGRPLRASDFRKVFERLFKVHSPVAGTFYSTIAGSDACTATPSTCDLSSGIVTNDAARTVVFHLTKINNEFLQQLALPFAFAIPQTAPDKDIGTQQLAGTGPYMWATYTPSREIRLIRNPYFKQWSAAAQPNGYPNEIDVRLAVGVEDAVTQVENGQADYVVPVGGTLPADRLDEISRRFASQVHVSPVAGIFYMAMNIKTPPFNSPLVRRAINYATDREAIAKLYGGSRLAHPTCQILPPDFPGYSPYCPYSLGGGGKAWKAPDMAKARQLIAKSGLSGRPVTIVNPSTPTGTGLGLYFKDLLNQLGFVTDLKLLAPSVSNPLAKNSANKVQMTASVWFQDYPAASDFLGILVSCATFLPNNNSNPNISEFCDRKAEALMNKAAVLARTDQAAANKVWAQVDKRITDQAPMVVLVNPTSVNFVSKRVGNYEFNPQWRFLIDQAWVQ